MTFECCCLVIYEAMVSVLAMLTYDLVEGRLGRIRAALATVIGLQALLAVLLR